MMAERNKRAQILEAEGLKQAQILEAEGRKEAAFRDAEARERSAEAEARATQVVSEAISKGDVQALNYFVAQKYTEALATIGSASNSKVVLMPMEASSLIGSLGGIGAIAKRGVRRRRAARRHAARSVPVSEPRSPSARPAAASIPLHRAARRARSAMLERLVSELGPWNWMVLGCVLLALEIIAPRLLPAVDRHCRAGRSVPCRWRSGTRASGPGKCRSCCSWRWRSPLPMSGSRVMRGRSDDSDQPLLNRRGEQMVGQHGDA